MSKHLDLNSIGVAHGKSRYTSLETRQRIETLAKGNGLVAEFVWNDESPVLRAIVKQGETIVIDVTMECLP